MRCTWLGIIFSSLLFSNIVFAQTTTNTVNADWTNNADWTGTAPDYDTNQSATIAHNSTLSGNPIIVNDGYTLIINAGVTLTTDESITIKEGGTLIINGTVIGTDAGKEFKIEKGTLTINTGGILDWAGFWTSDDDPANITINGSVNVDGDMSNKVSISGTGTFDVGGTLNNDGGDVFGCTDAGAACCSGGGCTLPIELLSFKGKFDNGFVRLSWSTASEINNDFFTIERSGIDLQWDIVDYVEGAGNSNQTLTYNYTDQQPLNGFAYYRLKQTDFDGSFAYSSAIVVYAEPSKPHIALYPNPVRDTFFLNLEIVENRDMFLNNSAGQQFNIATKITHNRVEFDVSHLPKGVYFLTVVNSESTSTFKFVVN